MGTGKMDEARSKRAETKIKWLLEEREKQALPAICGFMLRWLGFVC